MVSIKRAPVAAAGTLIIAAAAFLALPALDRAAREAVGAAVGSAKAGIESLIGLTMSFDALSPSILRSASLSGLKISAPDGRVVLEAKKVRVYYDILALLSGDASRAVTGLGLEGASLDLRLPKDRALIDRLSSLLSGSGGGGTPRILVTGKSIEASLHLEGFGAIALAARDLSFSTLEDDIRLSLDGRASLRGEGGRLDGIEGPVELSGLVAKDFGRARLGLSLGASSRDFSLSTQRFELVYAGDAITLTKVKDKAPIDAEIRYELASGDIGATILMQGYAPSSSLRLGSGYEDLRPWLNMPYYGKLSLKVPGGDASRLSYVADVSGSLPKGIVPRGPGASGDLEARLAASGDRYSVSIASARLESPDMELEYRGAFRFADLSPDGVLDARLGLLGGRLPIESSIRISEADGEYSASAGSASVAGVEVKDLVVLASRKGSLVDFRASMRPPEATPEAMPEAEDAPPAESSAGFSGEAGTGAGRLPSIALEGSASLGAAPGLELLVDVSDLDAGPLEPVLAAASGSADAAALARDLRLGFELFLTTDFKRLSWSAPEVELASRSSSDSYAAFSLAGTDRSLSVKNALLSFGGYSIKGSGRMEARASGGMDFEASIDLADIPYILKGSLAEGGFSMTGDYGFELSAAAAGEDTYFGATARDLPLPFAGGVFLATLDATGRFRDIEDWSMSLSRLDLLPAGESLADYPSVGLAGTFGPGKGYLRPIRIADKISTVSGEAALSYSLEGGFSAKLDAELSGSAPEGAAGVPEAYALTARYDTAGIRGEIEVGGFPMARIRGAALAGSLDGRASFSGSLSDPVVDFRARLRDGSFQDQALSFSAAGSFASGAIGLSSLDAAFQGIRVSETSGRLSLSSGAGSIRTLVSGAFMGEPVAYSIEAESASSAREGAGSPFEGYSVEGKASRAAGAAESWPFSVAFGESGLAVRAGASDELSLDYRSDKSFSISLKDPLPARVEASGSYDGKSVELSARGLELDVSLLQSFVDPKDLAFESGWIRGDFSAAGLAADPDIEGHLRIEDAMLRVPGWIADPIGPIDAPIEMADGAFSAAAQSVPVGRAAVTARANGVFDHWLPSELTASISSIEGSKVRLGFVVIGIRAEGEAAIDLKGRLEGDVFRFDVDAAFAKADVVVTPEALGPAGDEPPPEDFPVRLDLSANLRFGRGVRVYFPYRDSPVVTAYSEPSSSLRVLWDQSTGEYSVKGAADLRGGEVFYIQRNFFLKSGRMVFNEETGMFDPRVTLLAELRERNDDGPVLITLRADNMPIASFKPRLSSDPAMTEAQIALMLGQNLLGAGEEESFDFRKAVISTSEFIPQLDIAKAFENKLREAAGLDILFLRTQVLQRWLIDISGDTEESPAYPLGRYLDSSELYMGKYLSDSIFAYGSARLREDPLAGAVGLRIDSEFGVELDTPFGLVQWTIAPNHWEDLLISDQSLSLSWRLSY